ncbi:unnamed protein product, partial [Prorocentrum cordatum]
ALLVGTSPCSLPHYTMGFTNGCKQPFTVCGCGQWAFNFRIERNNGKCIKCGAKLQLYKPQGGQGAGNDVAAGSPWREGRQGRRWGGNGGNGGTTQPAASNKQQNEADELKKALELCSAILPDDAMEQAKKNLAAKTETEAKARTPSQQVQSTAAILEQKEAALQKAADALVKAEDATKKAKEAHVLAGTELLKAKKDHEDAVQSLASTVSKRPVDDTTTSDGKKVIFAFDMSLLNEGLDQLDEEKRRELEGHRAALDTAYQAMVAEDAKVREMWAKIEEIKASPPKRARVEVASAAEAPAQQAAQEQPAAAAQPAAPAAEEKPDVAMAGDEEQAVESIAVPGLDKADPELLAATLEQSVADARGRLPAWPPRPSGSGAAASSGGPGPAAAAAATGGASGGPPQAAAAPAPAAGGAGSAAKPGAQAVDALRQEAASAQRAKRQHCTDATVFFSNITKWGPQARGFMRAQAESYDLVGLVETHANETATGKARSDLSRDGWKLLGTPARLTGRSATGTSGGEWMVAKKQIQTTSFEAWREAGRSKSGQDPFEGFCPTCWHLKSGNIVIVSAYLLPQLGFKEANQRALVRLGAFLRQLRDPWAVLGDWNITPDEWDKTQWLTELNAERLLAENCTATCSRGSGSAIDYALVSKGTAAHLKLQAVEEVPWKDHVGLKLTIKDGKQRWWHRKLDIARELPTVPRPKKQADPNSKRQKGIQKAKEERRARLHEHLQAAFDEMYDELGGDDDEREAAPTTTFNIPGQVWEDASAAVDARGLAPGVTAWERPASPLTATSRSQESKDHFLLTRDPQGQQKIDSHFARWITTLELATLQHHEIDTDKQDAYVGRGRGYAIKLVRTSATPARAHLRDPHLEWWHIAATLLKRYEMLRRTDRISEAASCYGKIVELMQKAEETQLHEVFNKDVIPIIEISERYQGRAIGQALTKSRKAYQSWAIKMWKEAPRHLHNMVKDPRPETVEKIQQGSSVADPDQIMSNRADEWEKHWADPSVTPDQLLDGIHM